jgi:precorrin-6A/cobalt-precorrin-6A reductase
MIFVLAGTTEGRKIVKSLVEEGIRVIASTATPYGGELLDSRCEVITRPLNTDDMIQIIKNRGVVELIDATHPFARKVSENAKKAAKLTGISYKRINREEVEAGYDKVICVDSFQEAAQVAKKFNGTVFLTIGSKNLEAFAMQRKHYDRLVARILPINESLEKARNLGFKPVDIIALQGPFSVELNETLFKEYDAGVVITKDSGYTGGLHTKIKAAKHLNIPVIIINKPKI